MSFDKINVIDKLETIFSDTFSEDDYVFSSETGRDDIDEWDSLNHIRLLTAIEAEFGFQFDLNEIEELTSVSAIADIIQNRLS